MKRCESPKRWLIPLSAWVLFGSASGALFGQVYEQDTGFAPAFRNEALVPQFFERSDGSLWVLGCSFLDGVPVQGIIRFRADDSMDAPLVIPDPYGEGVPSIESFVESDGAAVMYAAPHFLRVLPDGAIDQAYLAPTIWSGSVDRLVPSFGGGVLVASHSMTLRLPDDTLIENRTVVRLQSDGAWDQTFPEIAGSVQGVDLAGRFYAANGSQVLRYLDSGSSDPAWSIPQLDGFVQDFHVRPAGGGIARTNTALVLIDATGTIDPTFAVQGAGTEDLYSSEPTIRFLANGKILVLRVSDFSYAPNPTQLQVFRLQANGQLDESYVPPTTIGKGAGFWGDRPLVAYRDGHARPLFAGRLLEDGQLDPTWTPRFGSRGSIQAMRADDQGRVLVAGFFDHVGDEVRNGVVRLLPDGSVDDSFVPSTDAQWVFMNDIYSGRGYDDLRLGRDGSVFLHETVESPLTSPISVRWTRLTSSGTLHLDQPPSVSGAHDASAASDGSLYYDQPYSRDDSASAGTYRLALGFKLVRRAPGSTVDEILPTTFAEWYDDSPSPYHAGLYHASPFEMLVDDRVLVALGLPGAANTSALVSTDGTQAVALPFHVPRIASTYPIHGQNQITSPDGIARYTVQRVRDDDSFDQAFVPSWTLGDLHFLADDGRGGAIVRRTPAFSEGGDQVTRLRSDGTLDPGLTLDAADVTGVVAAGDRSLFVYNYSQSKRYWDVKRFALIERETVTIAADTSSIIAGRALTLSAGAGISGDTEWRWQHDGVDVIDATGPTLVIRPVSLADTGSYVASATVDGQTLQSQAVDVIVQPANARLVNLSARTRVSAGDAQQIAGFVLAAPAGVVLRAVGPTLAFHGVQQPLSDSAIVLRDDVAELAQNSGWADAPELTAAFQRVGAFQYPSGSADSALLANLSAGLFTAKVSGSADGIGLAEVYLENSATTAPLLNLSIRAEVGQGEQSVIAGLVVSGDGPQPLLVRAVGPGLAGRGISSPMADPSLTIYRDSAAIVTNDDATAEALAAESVTGAFPLEPGAGDAATVVYLEPGNYTAVVTGDGGIVLVEVYAMPVE